MSTLGLLLTNQQTNNFEDEDWNTSYTLRHSMLPNSYITVELAMKILFIGKAILIL